MYNSLSIYHLVSLLLQIPNFFTFLAFSCQLSLCNWIFCFRYYKLVKNWKLPSVNPKLNCVWLPKCSINAFFVVVQPYPYYFAYILYQFCCQWLYLKLFWAQSFLLLKINCGFHPMGILLWVISTIQIILINIF